MRYKNPYYKEIKKSYILILICSSCKSEVLRYQKIGKGGLIKLFLERITYSEFEIREERKIISCPKCENRLGVKSKDKIDSKQVYKMIQGSFNTKWLKKI